MKLTFVQSDAEQRVADRVILNGLSLKKAKVGTWILPPAHSKDGKFTVVDSPTGKDVYVESFDTIDTTDVPFFISREKVGGTREKAGMAEGQA